jgi:hypothetical protein
VHRVGASKEVSPLRPFNNVSYSPREPISARSGTVRHFHAQSGLWFGIKAQTICHWKSQRQHGTLDPSGVSID